MKRTTVRRTRYPLLFLITLACISFLPSLSYATPLPDNNNNNDQNSPLLLSPNPNNPPGPDMSTIDWWPYGKSSSAAATPTDPGNEDDDDSQATSTTSSHSHKHSSTIQPSSTSSVSSSSITSSAASSSSASATESSTSNGRPSKFKLVYLAPVFAILGLAIIGVVFSFFRRSKYARPPTSGNVDEDDDEYPGLRERYFSPPNQDKGRYRPSDNKEKGAWDSDSEDDMYDYGYGIVGMAGGGKSYASRMTMAEAEGGGGTGYVLTKNGKTKVDRSFLGKAKGGAWNRIDVEDEDDGEISGTLAVRNVMTGVGSSARPDGRKAVGSLRGRIVSDVGADLSPQLLQKQQEQEQRAKDGEVDIVEGKPPGVHGLGLGLGNVSIPQPATTSSSIPLSDSQQLSSTTDLTNAQIIRQLPSSLCSPLSVLSPPLQPHLFFTGRTGPSDHALARPARSKRRPKEQTSTTRLSPTGLAMQKEDSLTALPPRTLRVKGQRSSPTTASVALEMTRSSPDRSGTSGVVSSEGAEVERSRSEGSGAIKRSGRLSRSIPSTNFVSKAPRRKRKATTDPASASPSSGDSSTSSPTTPLTPTDPSSSLPPLIDRSPLPPKHVSSSPNPVNDTPSSTYSCPDEDPHETLAMMSQVDLILKQSWSDRALLSTNPIAPTLALPPSPQPLSPPTPTPPPPASSRPTVSSKSAIDPELANVGYESPFAPIEDEDELKRTPTITLVKPKTSSSSKTSSRPASKQPKSSPIPTSAAPASASPPRAPSAGRALEESRKERREQRLKMRKAVPQGGGASPGMGEAGLGIEQRLARLREMDATSEAAVVSGVTGDGDGVARIGGEGVV